MRLKKENLGIILVMLLALMLRFWRLDLNPVGIVHDEIHQLVNAKSLALTGMGAAGTGAGIFQNEAYCDGNCIFGELPTYLLIPFAFFKTSFPSLKIPFVLASVLMIFWFIKLFENLTKNKWIGIIVGLMIAINPWAINFGRTAYENTFAFMFYGWSFYLLAKEPFKLKNQIWAIILGFMASLCYFGAKPIFVPLILIGLGYGFWIERKNIKKYLLLALMTILLMGGYGLILKNSNAGSRLKETSLINEVVRNQVNEERRKSLEIPIVRDIFINKYTVLGKVLLTKYFAGLAPDYLFNQGEVGFDHFMITNHAFMYLFDLPMIILGFYALGTISASALVFILTTILVLPITSILGNSATTYALRNGLIYPILAAIVGIGIYFLITKIKNKNWKKVMEISLGLVYLISLINFLVMYWYRNPVEKSVGWLFYEREAVRYIDLVKDENQETKFEIVTGDPVDLIYAYALFSGKINDKNFILKMNEVIKNRSYEIDGIKFSKNCPVKIDDDVVYLTAADKNCVKNQNNLVQIVETRDYGAKWLVPNDILCKDIKLGQHPSPKKIEEFKIENMDKETFCKTWISKTL
ncbi:MAG TPA: hypothetical protein PK257_02190 [Candidatus Woesebacteria bacterium]|nr:hypothetical protein [Candidatus Woesebacteria bacterium]